MSEAVRVVVVDDSPFVCRLVASYLDVTPGLHVVGTAHDGTRGVELVKKLHPHVVTLDVQMPGMSGLETLDHIMHECPTPVVMVSGISRQAAMLTLDAVNMGAVDFILKYTPGVNTDPETLRLGIVSKVRAAAGIRVVRSLRLRQAYPNAVPVAPRAQGGARRLAAPPSEKRPNLLPSVLVIGSSTGGPTALREMLGCLPADFPAAIIIVQHMPEAFTTVLAAQLDRYAALTVREATDGCRLELGTVLVAPGGLHLLLRPDSRVQLNEGPPIGGHRPSIDATMQSVAQVYGARTLGVVLTGMGADGAMGLVAIHAKGGMTFAQDAESCVVDGMPQRARETGIVDYVAPPVGIAQRLATLQWQPWRRRK